MGLGLSYRFIFKLFTQVPYHNSISLLFGTIRYRIPLRFLFTIRSAAYLTIFL
jgi:hypothetical protein